MPWKRVAKFKSAAFPRGNVFTPRPEPRKSGEKQEEGHEERRKEGETFGQRKIKEQREETKMMRREKGEE